MLAGLCLSLFAACDPDNQSDKRKSVAKSQEGIQLPEQGHAQATPSRVFPLREGDSIQALSSPMRVPQSAAEVVSDLPAGIETPEGMIFVPGGELELGAKDGLPREQPVFRHLVQGFFMDVHPVTVAQFRDFVAATSYVTEAERFGNSIVHDMKGQPGWHMVDGANWQYPRGPEGGKAADDHPVTQVSFRDAQAYCQWAGKRLPREIEWEHAARNGRNDRNPYSWGQEIRKNGVYKANFWQGNFPYQHQVQDGFEFTNPVGKFGKTPLGLTDMAGNVWEWCDDWYVTYGSSKHPVYQDPNQPEKVMRGGSFMCDPDFCHGYRVSGRSGTTPESGLFHIGFRCVQNLPI